MHELIAFFRAMEADPADVVTPLILADWLEERNDPRAGYVRLAHEWLVADRAAEEQQFSDESLEQCYQAMSRAKSAFLVLLNTVLRHYLRKATPFTAIGGFPEWLETRPQDLPGVVGPTSPYAFRQLTLTLPPATQLPDRLLDFTFPIVDTVQLVPGFFLYPTPIPPIHHAVLAWLETSSFPSLANLHLAIDSYKFGESLAWLASLDLPAGWAVRVSRPWYRVQPPLGRDWVMEQYGMFSTSPIARRLPPEDVEAIHPDRLALPPAVAPSPPVRTLDFFRFTNRGQYRSWASPAEKSVATVRAVERANAIRLQREQTARSSTLIPGPPTEDDADPPAQKHDWRAERRTRRRGRS